VTPDTTIATAQLDAARELIRSGEYDRAVEVLKGSIARDRTWVPRLEEAYLLLIKTYVFLGNDLRFKPQGREASNLNYQEAKRLIAECLSIPELRHLQPEPASEYPPEMITFFAEVRGQIFGSFRVLEVKPPGAVVQLDDDTLRVLGEGPHLGDVDIPIGAHSVVVKAPGYQSVTEQITISPGATLERSYTLKKNRGATWYAAIAAGAAAVVGGVLAIAGGGGTTPEEPLPEAPPPPGQ
jgi:hypothetical protein